MTLETELGLGSRLAHIVRPASVAPDWSAPNELLRAFQRFFAVKLCATLFTTWAVSADYGGWVHIAALIGSTAMFASGTARLGAVIWFIIMLGQVLRTWPLTINHFFLETAILLLFACNGGHAAPSNARPERSREGQLIWALWVTMLSLWFYSGLQKLLHGYYVGGELFASYALLDHSTVLGGRLRALLAAFGPSPTLAPLGSGDLAVSVSHHWVLLLSSWAVLGSELAAPLLTLLPRFRRLGVGLLVSLQAGVAGFSGEYDFALTGLAVLGLSSTTHVTLRYTLLAVAAVLLTWFAP